VNYRELVKILSDEKSDLIFKTIVKQGSQCRGRYLVPYGMPS